MYAKFSGNMRRKYICICKFSRKAWLHSAELLSWVFSTLKIYENMLTLQFRSCIPNILCIPAARDARGSSRELCAKIWPTHVEMRSHVWWTRDSETAANTADTWSVSHRAWSGTVSIPPSKHVALRLYIIWFSFYIQNSNCVLNDFTHEILYS